MNEKQDGATSSEVQAEKRKNSVREEWERKKKCKYPILFPTLLRDVRKGDTKHIVTPKLINKEMYETLWHELKCFLVNVCSCCNGVTEDTTLGFEDDKIDMGKMDPEMLILVGVEHYGDLCGGCDEDCGRRSDDDGSDNDSDEGSDSDSDDSSDGVVDCENPKNYGEPFCIHELLHLKTMTAFVKAMGMDSTRELNRKFFENEPDVESKEYEEYGVTRGDIDLYYLARLKDVLNKNGEIIFEY